MHLAFAAPYSFSTAEETGDGELTTAALMSGSQDPLQSLLLIKDAEGWQVHMQRNMPVQQEECAFAGDIYSEVSFLVH